MTLYDHDVAKLGGKRLLLLGWGILWRMAFWGLCAGTLLGSIYGCAIIFVIGGIYGLLIGGVLGLVTGLLSGIIMAAIAVATLPHVRNRRRFAGLLRLVPLSVILVPIAFQVISTLISDWQDPFRVGDLSRFWVQE